MKKKYERAEMRLIEFAIKDIIVTSGDNQPELDDNEMPIL